MTTRAPPIPFAGSQLGEIRQVGACFNGVDEEYSLLPPFIRDGCACGHKAAHAVKPEQRDEHLRRPAVANVDTLAAERSGQLEVRSITDTYLQAA